MLLQYRFIYLTNVTVLPSYFAFYEIQALDGSLPEMLKLCGRNPILFHSWMAACSVGHNGQTSIFI